MGIFDAVYDSPQVSNKKASVAKASANKQQALTPEWESQPFFDTPADIVAMNDADTVTAGGIKYRLDSMDEGFNLDAPETSKTALRNKDGGLTKTGRRQTGILAKELGVRPSEVTDEMLINKGQETRAKALNTLTELQTNLPQFGKQQVNEVDPITGKVLAEKMNVPFEGPTQVSPNVPRDAFGTPQPQLGVKTRGELDYYNRTLANLQNPITGKDLISTLNNPEDNYGFNTIGKFGNKAGRAAYNKTPEAIIANSLDTAREEKQAVSDAAMDTFGGQAENVTRAGISGIAQTGAWIANVLPEIANFAGTQTITNEQRELYKSRKDKESANEKLDAAIARITDPTDPQQIQDFETLNKTKDIYRLTPEEQALDKGVKVSGGRSRKQGSRRTSPYEALERESAITENIIDPVNAFKEDAASAVNKSEIENASESAKQTWEKGVNSFDSAKSKWESGDKTGAMGDFVDVATTLASGFSDTAMDNPMAVVTTFAESLPQMMASGKMIGANIGMAVDIAAKGRKDFVAEHGREPEGKEVGIILAAGLSSAMAEKIGAKASLDPIQKVAKGITGKGKDALKAAGKGFAEETVTEFYQGAAEEYAGKQYFDKVDLGGAYAGSVLGGLAGGGAASVGGGASVTGEVLNLGAKTTGKIAANEKVKKATGAVKDFVTGGDKTETKEFNADDATTVTNYDKEDLYNSAKLVAMNTDLTPEAKQKELTATAEALNIKVKDSLKKGDLAKAQQYMGQIKAVNDANAKVILKDPKSTQGNAPLSTESQQTLLRNMGNAPQYTEAQTKQLDTILSNDEKFASKYNTLSSTLSKLEDKNAGTVIEGQSKTAPQVLNEITVGAGKKGQSLQSHLDTAVEAYTNNDPAAVMATEKKVSNWVSTQETNLANAQQAKADYAKATPEQKAIGIPIKGTKNNVYGGQFGAKAGDSYIKNIADTIQPMQNTLQGISELRIGLSGTTNTTPVSDTANIVSESKADLTGSKTELSGQELPPVDAYADLQSQEEANDADIETENNVTNLINKNTELLSDSSQMTVDSKLRDEVNQTQDVLQSVIANKKALGTEYDTQLDTAFKSAEAAYNKALDNAQDISVPAPKTAPKQDTPSDSIPPKKEAVKTPVEPTKQESIQKDIDEAKKLPTKILSDYTDQITSTAMHQPKNEMYKAANLAREAFENSDNKAEFLSQISEITTKDPDQYVQEVNNIIAAQAAKTGSTGSNKNIIDNFNTVDLESFKKKNRSKLLMHESKDTQEQKDEKTETIKENTTAFEALPKVSDIFNEDTSDTGGVLSKLPNFLSLVNSGLDSAKDLADSVNLTEEDLAFLQGEEFTSMTGMLTDSINNSMAKPASLDDIVANPLLMLANENGVLPTNVVEAMSIAGSMWTASRGSETLTNDSRDVNQILNMKDDSAKVPTGASEVLTDIGSQAAAIAQDLGMSVIKSLGLKMSKTLPLHFDKRLQQAIGNQVLIGLATIYEADPDNNQKGGLIQYNTIEQGYLNEMAEADSDTANLSYSERQEVKFVRMSTDNNNRVPEAIDNFLGEVKKGSAVVDKLLGEHNISKDVLSEPKKTAPKKLQGTPMNVPKAFGKNITKVQEVPYAALPKMMNLYQSIGREAFAQMSGAPSQADIDAANTDQKGSLESQREVILRGLEKKTLQNHSICLILYG